MKSENNIKVSVIVPIYNMEKYLDECLNSLIGQTLKDIELILVNDGSNDKSSEIIANYKKKHNNIKVITQENKGLSFARAVGINNSIGEFIGFVDADDFVAPCMYEKMYMKAKEENSEVIISNYSFYPTKIKTKEKWFKPYLGEKNWNFIERNTQPWNKIVKTEFLKKIDLSKSIIEGSDGAYIRVLLEAEKIQTINEELYFYRVGQQSMSSSYQNVKMYTRNIELTSNQANYLIGKPYENKLKEYFEYRTIYATLQALLIFCLNNEKEKYFEYNCKLKQSNYLKNQLTIKILRHNYGLIKSVFLLYVVPNFYILSRNIGRWFLK